MFLANRKHPFEIVGGARDDVDADQLADAARRQDMGERARRYAEGGQKVADEVMLALAPLIERVARNDQES